MTAWLIVVILLGLAVLLDLHNGITAFANARNRAQPELPRRPQIPVLAQVFSVAAMFVAGVYEAAIPTWVFWTIGLADAALITVFYEPIRLMREQSNPPK
ncbi:MAG: hypothetical protein ABI411_12065 [Tahibacter sp.]